MRFVASRKAEILSGLDQSRKSKDCHGEMACIHSADSVLTNEAERTILYILLISGDHRHRTVRPQVPIEQIQEAGLITAPRPGRTNQSARYLDSGPSAGDEPNLGIFQQGRGLSMAELVGKVGTR